MIDIRKYRIEDSVSFGAYIFISDLCKPTETNISLKIREQKIKEKPMSEQLTGRLLARGPFISLTQAATLTPYSAEYLGLLARKNRLAAKKIGRDWLSTQPAVLFYLRRQQLKHAKKLKTLQFKQGRVYAA